MAKNQKSTVLVLLCLFVFAFSLVVSVRGLIGALAPGIADAILLFIYFGVVIGPIGY